MSISYQCEDIDEREQDEQICKSWREVEAVASAEQDCQADEIACKKHQNCFVFVYVFLYLSLFFIWLQAKTAAAEQCCKKDEIVFNFTKVNTL